MRSMVERRRFLAVVGASAACAGFPPARAAARSAPDPVVWKGTALGALASITLVHEDRAHARRVLDACLEEVERLERVFSLYRADSALVRLNDAGELRAPPPELVELLSASLALARASAGAFDPTIQPLYRLYEAHFRAPDAAPEGPDDTAVAGALRRVDHRRVEVGADRIALGARGMALTLNGIAQGYVTDRVADRLRGDGFAGVAIDLGEARAAGRRADGRAWTAAVVDPDEPSRTLFELTMGDGAGQVAALATSAGAGTRFGADPRVHHLFDPRTGRSANRHASVSVAASRATVADGLSTALSIVAPERARALLAAYPAARAWLLHVDGTIETMPAG
ncbi:MAG: FAD:protein FMN transferase [Burkholderiaceae bacterium]|nr:FAD:protein FMN transferase [Burkholderiaceae bacterium]